MRLTSSGVYARAQPVPKMPAGLVELMEDLTKNVLRHNPTDLYEYCTQHMAKLLEIRDGRSPLKRLTVEQKIARAQEIVRRRADERRKKYDEEMRLFLESQQLVERNKPNEQVKVEDTPIAENIMKTPIHHEEDLKEALEVEIFHEPVQNDKSKDQIEHLKSEQNTRTVEIPVALNERVEPNVENKHDDLPADDVSSIENSEHIRKPRSVNLEEITKSDDQMPVESEADVETDNILVKSDEERNNTTEPKFEVHDQNEIVEEGIKAEVDKDNAVEKDKHFDNQHHPNSNVDLETIKSNDSDALNVTETENKTDSETINSNISDALNITETDSKNSDIPTVTDISGSDKANDNTNDISKKTGLVSSLNKNEVNASVDPKNADQVSLIVDENLENNNETLINITENEPSAETNDKDNETGELAHHNNVGVEDETVETETEIEVKTNEISNTATGKEDDSDKERRNVVKELNNAVEVEENHIDIVSEENVTKQPLDVGKIVSEVGNVMQDKKNVNETKDAGVDAAIIAGDVNSSNNVQTENVIETPVTGEHKKLEIITNKEISYENAKEKDPQKLGHKSETVEEVEIVQTKDEVRNKEISNENLQDTKNKELVAENGTETTMINIFPVNEEKVESEDIKKLDEKEEKTEDAPETASITQENVGKDIIPQNSITDVIILESEADNGNSIKVVVDEKNKRNSVKSESIETKDDVVLSDDKTKATDAIEIPSCTDTEIVNEPLHETDAIEMIIAENGNSDNDAVNDFANEKSLTSNKEDSQDLEKSKVHEDNSDTLENVSFVSEPVQYELETASIGKSSSMDDIENTIDDGNDSALDLEVPKNSQSDSTSVNSNHSQGMDLEMAAVTIQKVFRTFMFKSRGSTFEDTGNDENISTDDDNEKEEMPFPSSLNKERRPLGITRMDTVTVLQTVNEEKSLSLSTDDSSTLSSAATTIQAHVRGFLVRNRLNSNKTASSASLVNSDGPSTHSLEADGDQQNGNKTILNIHIVPEGGHYLSRDESLLTSMELSLDSPPSSVNLHPLGYDKSEPRKQLKREDAIQSISPPSNNSGKLSEDSVKEITFNDTTETPDNSATDSLKKTDTEIHKSSSIETIVEVQKADSVELNKEEHKPMSATERRKRSFIKMSSDESDVVTPFVPSGTSPDSDKPTKLEHSGEFHDVMLPTKVTRTDPSVVREFKNVLVKILLWNNS